MKKAVYYIRKGISAFGWASAGAFSAIGIEFGWEKFLILGVVLAIAVGILPNLDNEKTWEEE